MIDYKITELTFSVKEENVEDETSSKVIAKLYAHVMYQTTFETGDVFAPVQTIAEKTFDAEGYVTDLKTYTPQFKTRDELVAEVKKVVEKKIQSDLKRASYTSYIQKFLSDEKSSLSEFSRDSASMTDMLNALNY